MLPSLCMDSLATVIRRCGEYQRQTLYPILSLLQTRCSQRRADFAPGVAALANWTKLSDVRRSDWCFHLANSTKHRPTRRLVFYPFALDPLMLKHRPRNRKYITYCIEPQSHGHK